MGSGMAIYRLLQNSPMGPDEIERLAAAYELALRSVAIKDRDDPITQLVAKKVIEVGQTGLRDPALISERVIKELELP
jgi:hypothetical protein